jgi:hypothetical protein
MPINYFNNNSVHASTDSQWEPEEQQAPWGFWGQRADFPRRACTAKVSVTCVNVAMTRPGFEFHFDQGFTVYFQELSSAPAPPSPLGK